MRPPAALKTLYTWKSPSVFIYSMAMCSKRPQASQIPSQPTPPPITFFQCRPRVPLQEATWLEIPTAGPGSARCRRLCAAAGLAEGLASRGGSTMSHGRNGFAGPAIKPCFGLLAAPAGHGPGSACLYAAASLLVYHR